MIDLPMTAAPYNETNPFAVKLISPKGAASFILSNQPKSLDWRARDAKPHSLKKVPEDAYIHACRSLRSAVDSVASSATRTSHHT